MKKYIKKVTSLLLALLLLSVVALPVMGAEAALPVTEKQALDAPVLFVQDVSGMDIEGAEKKLVEVGQNEYLLLAQPGNSLYWVAIASIKPSITVSGGTANIAVVVSGYTNCTSIKITATIQKKNLWWWDDVKSFTETTSGSSARLSKSHSVGSGSFQLVANVWSYKNGVQQDSATVTASP